MTASTNLGSTPLHVSYDSMECVKLLLEHHSPTSEPECFTVQLIRSLRIRCSKKGLVPLDACMCYRAMYSNCGVLLTTHKKT